MATPQQPWLKSYPQGISPQINVTEFSSIVDVFEKSVRKFAGRPAFTNLDHTLSFKDLDDQSRAFAAFLQKKLGLKKGDRIAIQMPNLLQYPVALFGALRAGLIVVNTNPLYTPREMEHQFKDSGARAVVILANFCHSLEEVLKTHQMEHVIITEIADLLPFPKRSLVNFVVKNVKKMVPKYNIPGAISFRTALSEGEALTLSRPDIGLDDTAFLQYTGGTTGVAKGAQLLHRNIVANLCQTSAWMAVRFQEGNETVITALPMYHIFSLTINCMLFMRYGGHNILITNPKDIPGFVKEMAKHPFTVFTGVNTLFNALMNNEEFKKLNFSPLKLSVGGGMAVQSAVAKRWYELTGTYLVQGYGLSETSPVLTCNPIDGTHRDGTIGVPVPNTEISIQDDQNNILPLGKEGEICGKGPQVMPGYWNRQDETAKVMIDGWFHTGDIGVMGEDGYITIVDRKKDMILVSGFNVYPNEIEDVVATHPSVLEVAAIGVPDEKSGEVPKIFVVRRNDSLTTDELKAFCKEKLTGYKVPKYIEFKKELPKTNVGKILRRALRDEELKQTKH